uniref:Afd-1 n=1 Tax=Pristionchus pacificus TaxID=54126 RepID=A0A2A6CD30_PRIPA|eukprot:PDM75911.1 afd-1 [Pristionchus pacificus]
MAHFEYEKLCRLVEQWNENRLDLFHLSQPTQDLEIEGVMRFYFCDDGGRVCTKCIRVSSTATTQAVIDALVDKFLPDLKMLTDPDYTLWEVHEGGEERRLNGDEKPLLVQLNWHKDDKEGRFLLKKHGMTFLPIQALKDHDRTSNIKRSNKRFSKREKKEDKGRKKHKEIITVHEGVPQENIDVMGLYKQVPPTTFTRTISNPEIVMKKRREKRIESKLRDMGHGGSVKIYGEEIVPSRPYVTILVSANDRAKEILREALRKYNVPEDEWTHFELVLYWLDGSRIDNTLTGRSLTDLTIAGIPHRSERVVSSDECPLVELANSQSHVQMFLIIRRKTRSTSNGHVANTDRFSNKCAYLVSLDNNNRIPISEGVTEVGNDINLHLFARNNVRLSSVCSRHCVITLTNGVFTITPSSPHAVIEINDRKIDQTESVMDGSVIRLGKDNIFRVIIPRPLSKNFSKSNESIVDLRREHNSSNPEKSCEERSGEVIHEIPISISIDEKSIRNLLIQAMSRSAESCSFPLSSSFIIFIGLHSLDDPSIIGVELLNRLCTHLSHVSNDGCHRDRIVYWLSNSSHLHHLLSSDICFTLPLDQLSSLVQSLFHSLVKECTKELSVLVHSFFTSRNSTERGSLVSLLDSIMSSCRWSQLNADITIQLASQLFASLNTAIFNQMIEMKCTSNLGHLVSKGLTELDEWSTGMGVELAAECLFDTCRQAANLLIAPKNDMASMGSTTYKLNSLQIRHLLNSFEVCGDEIGVGNDVLHRMIGLAERQADELSAEEGIPLTLLETNRLSGMDMIPPQDGYFTNRSQSNFEPLKILLDELATKGVCCNVKWNDDSIGWIMLNESNNNVVKIHLNRGNGGIGLSIVAAQGVGERQCGIYIKKVLEGSIADKDGRLCGGDELIQVNDKSLRGLSQEEAARSLSSCGPVVKLLVRKGAASRNGLQSYLVSPISALSPPSQSNNGDIRDGMPPSPTHLYTPSINRHIPYECNVTQSSSSAFSIPRQRNPSISTTDLYQGNDPNISFSGRSIASSTISSFSALPSHYKRPTVIQPARNCSPSTVRSGAISPSLLSHSSYRLDSSPHSSFRGTISPTPLSHSTSTQRVDVIHSPPIARSSPIPSIPLSQSLHSFSRSIDSSTAQSMSHLPPRVPSFERRLMESHRNVAESAALSAIHRNENKRNDSVYTNKHNHNNLIDEMEGQLLRMSVGAEARYGEIMGDSISNLDRPISTRIRKETLIDDIPDYDLDSPHIVGAQETYRDPRSKRFTDSSFENGSSFDGSKLGFGDKMRLFARGIGESTPPTRVTTSSAQRMIQNDH